MLNDIEFVWDAQQSAWDRQVKALKKFKEKNGHCHVPWRYEDDRVLCVWVRDQRRHYSYLQQGKPTHMTQERVAQLESMGFLWDTTEATWFQNYHNLVKYVESKYLVDDDEVFDAFFACSRGGSICFCRSCLLYRAWRLSCTYSL